MNPDWQQFVTQYEVLMSMRPDAMRVKATFKLANGYAKHLPEDALSQTIPLLVQCLSDDDPLTDSHRALQVAAVYCLMRVACQSGAGKLSNEIADSGAVQHILRLINSVSDDHIFQMLLLKCLWILVSYGDESRVVLARNHGVGFVLRLLNHCSDTNCRVHLLEILSALALLKEARKELVRIRGGIGYLIKAAATGTLASRERACQGIGLLGGSRQIRRALSQRGAIPVLVQLYRQGDDKTKLLAANALAVLSAHTDSIRPAAQAGAIPLYAELLAGPDPTGREIAEDAFSILAVAEPNAVSIADHIVITLENGNEESKAAAADVFWDIAVYKHEAPVVKNSGAIPVLVQLLRDCNNVGIREKVSAVISLLSNNKRDRDALVDAGAVQVLAAVVNDDASEDVSDNASQALVYLYEDTDHCSRVVEVIDVSDLQGMQDRVVEIREADELMDRSLRQMRRFITDLNFL